MSWQAGDVKPDWILRKRSKAVEYKLRLDDLREILGTDATGVDLDRYVLAPAVAEIDHLADVAMDYEMIAKPGLGATGRARAVVMVGVTERIVYNPSRTPRTFFDIGKPPSATPGRIIRSLSRSRNPRGKSPRKRQKTCLSEAIRKMRSAAIA